MPSKIRQLGDFAKQADDILVRIDNVDSSAILTIARGAGFDSSSLLAAVDSDYLSTRQNFSFGLLSVGSNTLSSLGITNAKTSTQQDSDITATVNTLKDGAPTELDDLNKIAEAINDDADFFNTVKKYTLQNAPKSIIQGHSYGFLHGGQDLSSIPGSSTNRIDRFPFASDANTSNIGTFGFKTGYAGSFVDPSGNYFVAGGITAPTSISGSPPTGFHSTIYRKNSGDVGDLSAAKAYVSSSQSSTHGYISGGDVSPPGYGIRTIEKVQMATPFVVATVGDLSEQKYYGAGCSSSHCGYETGGVNPQATPPNPTSLNAIERFPFAADTYSSDIADLTGGRHGHAGNSSDTHGYMSGGSLGPDHPSGSTPWASNTSREKFAFANNNNAADVGDLANAFNRRATGVNSDVSGYTAGASVLPTGTNISTDHVQKFPFASDADTSTNVSNMSLRRKGMTGWQT